MMNIILDYAICKCEPSATTCGCHVAAKGSCEKKALLC